MSTPSASVSSSSRPSVDIDNFVSALTCPIDHTPLREAMNLHPCADKISKSALEKIPKRPDGTFPCPFCRCTITGSTPDNFVRNLVEMVVGKKQNLLATAAALIKPQEGFFNESTPYPGNSSKFHVEGGAWQANLQHGVYLVREMVFKTQTIDPLIDEVRLCGYEKGKISLGIIFRRENRDILYSYLKQLSFTSHDLSYSAISYYFTHPIELKLIYNVLVKNNQFPEAELLLMHKVIEAGNWETITPLAAENQNTLESSSRDVRRRRLSRSSDSEYIQITDERKTR